MITARATLEELNAHLKTVLTCVKNCAPESAQQLRDLIKSIYKNDTINKYNLENSFHIFLFCIFNFPYGHEFIELYQELNKEVNTIIFTASIADIPSLDYLIQLGKTYSQHDLYTIKENWQKNGITFSDREKVIQIFENEIKKDTLWKKDMVELCAYIDKDKKYKFEELD